MPFLQEPAPPPISGRLFVATTITTDTNSVCDSCQALQAEREGETCQHTAHSGGTL